MSYIRHNAIVITSFAGTAIEEAAAVAVKEGLTVLGPSGRVCNGYRSLLVCPDGIEERFYDSAKYDEKRKDFKRWLDNQKYPDGSSIFDWVEVAYSSDDGGCADIITHAWANLQK